MVLRVLPSSTRSGFCTSRAMVVWNSLKLMTAMSRSGTSVTTAMSPTILYFS